LPALGCLVQGIPGAFDICQGSGGPQKLAACRPVERHRVVAETGVACAQQRQAAGNLETRGDYGRDIELDALHLRLGVDDLELVQPRPSDTSSPHRTAEESSGTILRLAVTAQAVIEGRDAGDLSTLEYPAAMSEVLRPVSNSRRPTSGYRDADQLSIYYRTSAMKFMCF
jgi:hypothetical protein